MFAFIVFTIITIVSTFLYSKLNQKRHSELEEERKQKEIEIKQERELQQIDFKANLHVEQTPKELKGKQEEEDIKKEVRGQKMAEARKQKQVRYKKFWKIHLQQEEEKRLKEERLKTEYLERKQKELEEKQKELEEKQKEGQKLRELKLSLEEERKAWARKMAAARLQKKLQKEKEDAEFLEEKRRYCIQLENELNSVGVSFSSIKEFCYDIFAPENIELDKTLCLLKELSQKQIYRTKNQRVYIQHNFYITDINNEKLIEITEFDEEYCGIAFYQEDREDIEFNKGNAIKQAVDFLFCYLGNRKIKRLENSLISILENGINQVSKLSIIGNTTEELVHSALESSNYDINFQKSIDCLKDNDMLIVDYELPNISNLSDIKEYKYVASTKEISIKRYTDSYISKRYENVLYSITLRSLYEIFYSDTENEIKGITFNGFVTQINPATGITERKCILSIQVDNNKFSQINLLQVEPKACFKALKGVSAAKLVDISPITPILTFNKKDRRFVEGKDVSVNQGTNLAAMHWEDFEHLVRELFEMEFARNGGEVRVTQASRDGGVDAIIFDPDPLRGGKIVVQAKRYTNTVGVSAVRDLYGTVINEGANTGILITTSDYGHDSYEFAKDKPLKLLNGGHLLSLLRKNGRNAHINIEEAKKINEGNRI